jgi:hypothetical protein
VVRQVPILVDFIQPASGEQVNLGESLPVTVQAIGEQPIVGLQLHMDGAPLADQSVQGGAMQPVQHTWIWQAASPGLHVFTARASDSSGRVGESSQLALFVSELGSPPNQTTLPGGQSLASFSEQAGIPLDELAGANPGLDPDQPLPGGTPVNLPVPEGVLTGGDPNALPAVQNPQLVPFVAQFSTDLPVDMSYCYQSNGGGLWQRAPAGEFEFIPGSSGPLQLMGWYSPGAETLALLLECWGWQGGELVPLGSGEAEFSPLDTPQVLTLVGVHFTAAGELPEMKPLADPGEGTIPPPSNLRDTEDSSVCAAHFGNAMAKFVCDGILNSPIKQYNILVWDWTEGFCWGGGECQWMNEIDGYRLYQSPYVPGLSQPIKTIKDPDQKASAVPLPWGPACYVATAYALLPDGSGIQESGPSNAWCPGQSPSDLFYTVLSYETGQKLITSADFFDIMCDHGHTGTEPFNLGAAEVLVGVQVHNFGSDDCLLQHYWAAGVRFDFSSLPLPDTISIQSAVLHFSQGKSAFNAGEGVATNFGTPLCTTDLGLSTVDFYNWDPQQAALGQLPFLAFNATPYQSLPWWYPPVEVNVTGIVDNWIHHPETNRGFVIVGGQGSLEAKGLLDAGNDIQLCWNHINGITLEIDYYLIP